MYYLKFGGILLTLIIITWSYYMNNKEVIVNGTKKMMNKPVRGIQKNQFPLWQRFISGIYYFINFCTLTIGPYIISIFVSIYNYKFFVPEDAIYGFDMSIVINSGKTVFYFFTFIFGVVPFLFVFDFLFCRGFLKKMDEAESNMSFRNYSKQVNTFGLLVCITLFVFLFGTNFNSYQYCTKDEVVIKKFYKFKEDRYNFGDIDKVVKILYRDDDGYHYVAWFKNGDKITIGDSDHDDISNLEKIFEEKIIYVEIDDSRTYR